MLDMSVVIFTATAIQVGFHIRYVHFMKNCDVTISPGTLGFCKSVDLSLLPDGQRIAYLYSCH